MRVVIPVAWLATLTAAFWVTTGPAGASESCVSDAAAAQDAYAAVTTCGNKSMAAPDPLGAAQSASSSETDVTYSLDPSCIRGGGTEADYFYGCGDQQTCGTDGELFDVWAHLPDGSTHIGGQFCSEPGSPGISTAPVLTPGRILEAFRRIPLPEAPLEVQPPGGETLVNFDTILHTQAEPFTETVQLLGRQVTFDITPASFTWSLGNGETMTTTDPGRPWARGVPMDQYVSHRYTEAGPVTLDLTTTWGARWRLGNGPWRDVDGTVTMTSPAQDLQVRTAQPQLVSYD